MAHLKIECIRSKTSTAIHERITHLGGRFEDGTPWRFTQTEAIRAVHENVHSFFVAVDGHGWVELMIRQGDMGHEYLTTRSDGETQNRLKALPACK